MAGSDEAKGAVKPSEQRGGRTPDEAEVREKGEWAGVAAEGLIPAELGGSDAPRESLADDRAASLTVERAYLLAFFDRFLRGKHQQPLLARTADSFAGVHLTVGR